MLLILLVLIMLALVLLLAIAAGGFWIVVLALRHRRSGPLPGRPRRSAGDWWVSRPHGSDPISIESCVVIAATSA